MFAGGPACAEACSSAKASATRGRWAGVPRGGITGKSLSGCRSRAKACRLAYAANIANLRQSETGKLSRIASCRRSRTIQFFSKLFCPATYSFTLYPPANAHEKQKGKDQAGIGGRKTKGR